MKEKLKEKAQIETVALEGREQRRLVRKTAEDVLAIAGNVLRDEKLLPDEEIEKLTTLVKGREEYITLTKVVEEKQDL